MGTQNKSKTDQLIEPGEHPAAEANAEAAPTVDGANDPEANQPQPESNAPDAEVVKVDMVLARVLISCRLGTVNDLVEVPANNVEGLRQLGYIDDSPAAVEYAQSLLKR